jgi:hypothetical protein
VEARDEEALTNWAAHQKKGAKAVCYAWHMQDVPLRAQHLLPSGLILHVGVQVRGGEGVLLEEGSRWF